VIKTAAGIITIIILFFGLWYVAVPEDLIVGLIEGSVKSDVFSLKAEDLKKGLLFNFTIERITLMKRNSRDTDEKIPKGSTIPLLAMEDVHNRISPLSLFTLKPELTFNGRLYGGSILGTVHLTQKTLHMQGSAISLHGIPLLGLFGIQGDGTLSGEVKSYEGGGEVRFSVDNLKLRNTSLDKLVLPLDLFHTMRGTLKFVGDTVDIQSLTLNGDGIRARIRGTIRGRLLDSSIEVMINSSSAQGPLFQAMFSPYQVSPGYYVIPVRTTLKGL
jgi:type II secretion system protein N